MKALVVQNFDLAAKERHRNRVADWLCVIICPKILCGYAQTNINFVLKAGVSGTATQHNTTQQTTRTDKTKKQNKQTLKASTKLKKVEVETRDWGREGHTFFRTGKLASKHTSKKEEKGKCWRIAKRTRKSKNKKNG